MLLEGNFPPDERVEKEAISLINIGFDVHVACYTFEKKGKSRYDHLDIKVHSKYINIFTYKSSIGCLDFPFYFRFWERFVWKLQVEGNFNFIHVHDLRLSKIGWKFKKEFNVPFILDLHENFPALLEASNHIKRFPGNLFYSSRQWNNYEKDSINNCDIVITVVEEMQERLICMGIPPDKIKVVPNTPNLDRLPIYPDQPDNNHITLFYSGGITIHRGLQVVIKALPMLLRNYTNIRLWIVGAGSYQDELNRLVKRLRLEKVVFFLGYKAQDEVFKLLSKSDIALIPHFKSVQTDNSSPNKLFHYLFYNKPIICSNCISLERILHESGTGFIYRNNSPEDFLKQAIHVLQENDVKKLGIGGRKLVTEKYNWEKTVDPLIDVYRSFRKHF